MGKNKERIIYTIGHSNRTSQYFLDLLQAFHVETVVDVRTIPKSRSNPQFHQDALKKELKKQKIAYVHLKKLGGLRHAKKDSPNTGWENASFRGFADYMQTGEFKDGLAELIDLAKETLCAVMCAEAVPWRCHRSLIADVLTLKKWKVYHIQSKRTAKAHELTPFLHKQGRKIVYAER
ncbi:MAG: DUF488 domain-containing protein [Simkaniaceae bacterium]